MILGSWLLDTLQPWAILGGNLVAALVMLGILFRDHHFSIHELQPRGSEAVSVGPLSNGRRRRRLLG